jgi:hypothetical protein
MNPKIDLNQAYYFTELKDEDLGGTGFGDKVPIFPIEGPAILRMSLSQRQFKDLKKSIELAELKKLNDSADTYNIMLVGITTKAGQDVGLKTCQCDLRTLMVSGCKCGKP